MLQGAANPTLRIYAWIRPCLSIGYGQSLAKDVDLEACGGLGIGVVRRPTGGGAILHGADLTYSLTAAETDTAVSGNIVESYRKLSQGLLAGLSRLGLTCKMATGDNTGLRAGPACFEVASAYEVTAAGRKLVGSAQYRRDGTILQQGSLPLDLHRERTYEVLRPGYRQEYTMRGVRFLAGAISLREALGRAVSFNETCEAIATGFQEALGIEFQPGEPTPEELRHAGELERDKYTSPSWTNMR